MLLVSVVIPAYGHADLILESIDSVFSQSSSSYEVIVVNDGSPDATAQVLRPLVRANMIRYFERPNQGVACARNFGVSQALGKYIAFLDDDDLWPADKLEWQVAAMEANPELLLVGGTWMPLGSGEVEEASGITGVEQVTLDVLFGGNPFKSPGQTLIRKSAFEEVGGLDPSLPGTDDLDLWMRLAARSPFKVYPQNSLLYRIHPGNASNNLAWMDANFRRTISKNLPLLPEDQRADAEFRSWMWAYFWLGRQLIFRFKDRALNFELKNGCLLLRQLTPYLRQAIGNRALRNAIWHDFRSTQRSGDVG